MRSRGSGWHTAVVAFGIFLSRIAGFLRERCFAHYLGNSEAAGAFRAALRIPNLLQNLFGEGALSASFIPVYVRLLAEGREADARVLARTIATALCCVVGLLAVAGSLAAPFLVTLVAPGFDASERWLAETLVAILFPATALLAMSAWCLGVLNSHRKFLLSYVAPVLWNAAIIAALLWFGRSRTGPDLVRTVAWSVVVGSALQLLVQLPSAWRLVGSLRPSWAFGEASARKVFKNFSPALLTRGVAQFSAYFDQVLSSFLGATAVAAIGYAQTLLLLPISLFGLAIATAELPELSGAMGSDEERHLAIRERLLRARRRLWFLVLPSFAASLALGDVLVATLFQTGRFGPEQVREVGFIVAAGSLALLPSTASRLFSSVFWALGDVARPAKVAFVRVFLSGAFGAVAVFWLREKWALAPMQAAALLIGASSVSTAVEYGYLSVALRRRIGSFSMPRSFVWSTILAAALATAGSYGIQFVPVVAGLSPALRGAVILGLFSAIYGGVCLLLHVEEARALIHSLLRRLR